MSNTDTIKINRAPVLTLWAAIVAQRLGFDHDEALTLGRALAGLNAQAKGQRLGIFEPTSEGLKEIRHEQPSGEIHVALLGRAIPAVVTVDGLRAMEKGKPSNPASVEKYLKSKFGEHLQAVETAMAELAKSVSKSELAATGFKMYEAFRPAIPDGGQGWGAKGELDLAAIRKAAGS